MRHLGAEPQLNLSTASPLDIKAQGHNFQNFNLAGSVVAHYSGTTGRRVLFALFDAQHKPLSFGASLEDSAGKQLAIADPNGNALALVEEDQGTLVIKWGDQQCSASYALAPQNKALNYERQALVCGP